MRVFKTFFLPIFSYILGIGTFYAYSNQEEDFIEIPTNRVQIVEKEVCSEENSIPELFMKIIPEDNYKKLKERYGEREESIDISSLSISEKKERFIEIVLPAILESRNKILIAYRNVLDAKMGDKKLTIHDEEYLTLLYEQYNIKDRDIDKLLVSLNPHPISIVLAQAAIASGWGTSRFFTQGNNIFSLISIDKNDDRIKVTNGDVYVKRYDSLVESVDDYMILLGRGDAYKRFRDTRAVSDDPYELIKYLAPYSQLREKYVEQLKDTIKYNYFQQYDK